MNDNPYILNSGGAAGSDLEWERIGREFGITEVYHWRPADYHSATNFTKMTIDLAVTLAARALKRPDNFKGIDLVKRNWFQVDQSEAVYAIGRIVPPGEKGPKGFTNNSGKEIVDGGTGWAVEMAIQMNKPVYVFDMNKNWWYWWAAPCGHCDYEFMPVPVSIDGVPFKIPTLTQRFAGIGSREITPEGIQAIRDVYTKTFKS